MTHKVSGKYPYPGHQCAPSRTSIASRSPSPRKLNAITVIMMASPGTVVRWGATNRKCLPSLTTPPREGGEEAPGEAEGAPGPPPEEVAPLSPHAPRRRPAKGPDRKARGDGAQSHRD